MSNRIVLLDVEQNMPPAQLLRDILEHYPTIYLFNCQGQFEYSLEHLTEFSAWVNTGKIIILDVPDASQKEFEYAVIVGQLLAMIPEQAHIEVISAMPSSKLLMELLEGSNISCHLIQIQPQNLHDRAVKNRLPSISTIKEKPQLKLVKKYCDALARMSGKPNTVEKLKNSISNTLQVVPDKAQQLVGMLINLKIIKRYEDQIAFRKKTLKEWIQLNLEEPDTHDSFKDLNQAWQYLESQHSDRQQNTQKVQETAQQNLFKNFAQIDPVQIEVARKLAVLKDNKPKDIYALRDLLAELFPQSDIRLLLKELLEKGYIYWNGYEVIYSHEMYFN